MLWSASSAKGPSTKMEVRVTSVGATIIAAANGRSVTLETLHRRLKRAGRLDLVREAAVEAVLDAALVAYGVSVSDQALQAAADAFRGDRRLHRADETRAWLAARGFTLDDFEAGIERDLLLSELRRRVVDDAAIDKRFAETRGDYAQARISILETETEAQAEEARIQIDEDEADFALLAARLSPDEDMRGAGGYVGWVVGGEIDDALRPLILSASPESVVGPARSGEGWALIKVWSVLQPTLDDVVRADIRARLFAEWIEAQLAAASIESPLLAANDA